jgi:hypothetical protein
MESKQVTEASSNALQEIYDGLSALPKMTTLEPRRVVPAAYCTRQHEARSSHWPVRLRRAPLGIDPEGLKHSRH